ncbi:class II fumarate hydratase [Biformimicrobium ophioploci]|uniref:Fumarate hydratase class II n=1 Tax=Biformimicrobium ophioploci TaxID=3036711 RepID=A0ABQ6LW01_9GAMM|nr:class II fumarate hydratase [Microbulbifer sp. NKW57]GMG86212.1 class II fumarate hydratase [Microbulbifer sp. NKW57]
MAMRKAVRETMRKERDSLGTVQVPADCLWGAQTERSRRNFRIGLDTGIGRMPLALIHAYAIEKSAAARANCALGVLAPEKCALIERVCDEILAGEHDDQFPLAVWQTGSGTQTNMNLNEVIANRACQLEGGSLVDGGERPLHPNDDVNRSQSSNDSFPTAMHIAAYRMLSGRLVPALENLSHALAARAEVFADTVKIGRTHMMDATPLTLGQEFSGYARQVQMGLEALRNSFTHLAELPIGGTAVGTGINAPAGFAARAVEYIAADTGLPFVEAQNRFAGLAAHDALVEAHAALKQLAVALMKVAGDIRLLASGPRCSIGEIRLPANEPGSSIMPGKVNPTQCEAMTMVCARVIGNDAGMAVAGMSGQLELNVFKPMMIATLLESAELLADAAGSFEQHCVSGIEADSERIRAHLDNSLMLVTALNPHIGYDRAAHIAKLAHEQGITLREAAVASGEVSAEDFDRWVQPQDMLGR